MNFPELSKDFVLRLAVALVAGLILVAVTSYFRIHEQTRAKVRDFHSLVSRMGDDTNGVDLGDNNIAPLLKDGAEFRDRVRADLNAEPQSLGIDNREMRAIVEALNSQVYAFENACGGDHPGMDRNHCGHIAFYYMRPSIEMLDQLLQSRL
jgi:hypothetical protein